MPANMVLINNSYTMASVIKNFSFSRDAASMSTGV